MERSMFSPAPRNSSSYDTFSEGGSVDTSPPGLGRHRLPGANTNHVVMEGEIYKLSRWNVWVRRWARVTQSGTLMLARSGKDDVKSTYPSNALVIEYRGQQAQAGGPPCIVVHREDGKEMRIPVVGDADAHDWLDAFAGRSRVSPHKHQNHERPTMSGSALLGRMRKAQKTS